MVAEFPVRGRRIDIVPEDIQELGIADLGGIEEDLDGLRMPRPSGRDLLVARVLRKPRMSRVFMADLISLSLSLSW